MRKEKFFPKIYHCLSVIKRKYLISKQIIRIIATCKCSQEDAKYEVSTVQVLLMGDQCVITKQGPYLLGQTKKTLQKAVSKKMGKENSLLLEASRIS